MKMKYVFILIISFMCGCTTEAEYMLTDDLIKKQRLKEPLSKWITLNSVAGGQIIQPTRTYKWQNLEGDDVYLSSEGKLVTYNVGDELTSVGNFGPTASEKLHSYQITRFNEKLKDKFEVESNLENLYHLRVFGNQKGLFQINYFTYDLTVYTDGNDAKYILVCLNYCHDKEPELIVVR